MRNALKFPLQLIDKPSRMMFKLNILWVVSALTLSGCALFLRDQDTFEAGPEGRNPASNPQRARIIANDPNMALSPGRRSYKREGLMLGMSMNEVIDTWGRPHDIEVAGQSHLQNERWRYSTTAIRDWKLRPERIVYFERGRVVGWEAPPSFP